MAMIRAIPGPRFSVADYPELRASMKVPAAITEKLDRHAELAELPMPEAPMQVAGAVAAGMDPDAAQQAVDAHSAQVARVQKLNAEVGKARALLLDTVQGMGAVERHQAEAIVTGPLRDAVEEVMTKAKPHAEKLQRFLPRDIAPPQNPFDIAPTGLDVEQVLSEGTTAEVKAFQAIVPLQRRFLVLLRYWAHLLVTSSRPGGAAKALESCVPGVPGGDAVWADPWSLDSAWLRGKSHCIAGDEATGRERSAPMHVVPLALSPVVFRLAWVAEVQAGLARRNEWLKAEAQRKAGGRAFRGGGYNIPREEADRIIREHGEAARKKK